MTHRARPLPEALDAYRAELEDQAPRRRRRHALPKPILIDRFDPQAILPEVLRPLPPAGEALTGCPDSGEAPCASCAPSLYEN